MINSRSLADLEPNTRAKAHLLQVKCSTAGIDLLITSTYRDHESQDELYAQGRTKPGKRVTNARGGYSAHNFRVAFDVVPIRNGKPVWGTKGADLELWTRIGDIGAECGLEWGGTWTRFKDYPHFQNLGIGRTLDYYRNHPEVWERKDPTP